MEQIIDIIEIIFPDTETALFFIVLTMITLWLYKQLQTRISVNEKENNLKTDKAIEAYAELDSQIRRFLRDESYIRELNLSLIKSSKYLPSAILVEFQKWIDKFEEDINFEQLTKLQKEIRDEIRRLKNTQVDPVSYRSNGGLAESIRVYYKNKLSTIVEPIFHTGLGIIFLMLSLLIVTMLAITEKITDKVLLISLLSAFVVFILVLDIMVTEFLMKSRFVHSLKNWTAFSFLIISNSVLFFVGPWYRGMLMVTITFAYAIYATRFSIKNLGKNKKVTVEKVGNT